MQHSAKYDVPQDLALLYDFLNSLDLRSYREKGAVHESHDELATPEALCGWMHAHSLAGPGSCSISEDEHRHALGLRDALRSYIGVAPGRRAQGGDAGECVSKIAFTYPLVVNINDRGGPELLPSPGASQLGRVLVELYGLALTGRLDRLKMCDSKDCQWIFFDRSKPGNRRWCSSALCGNRHKTRRYRQRARSGD